MMNYVRRLYLPGESEEIDFLWGMSETCYEGYYPFKIFPGKELERLEFYPLTLLYGGNGSGKSTLLNIIAQKAGVKRHAIFAGGAFFDAYLKMCRLDAGQIPAGSEILTSDDVFEYLLNLRGLNNGIDIKREALFEEFAMRKYRSHRLSSLEEYDDWKESLDAKTKTRSRFVNDRLHHNERMASNGESAMRYFIERIKENALYLIDEPENSLSVSLQEELAKFLSDSARFFGCQFMIATHSPILLAMEGAVVYDLDTVPVCVRKWTELPNVRSWFAFFEEHREEFF